MEVAGWKKALPGAPALARRVCRAVLRAVESKGEVCILLADDARMRALNHDFRGKDAPTNVLSFPDGEGGRLGDIALGLERVLREAAGQGKAVREHFLHLVVHGCLHLLGYDHETARDAREMESLEVRILAGFGVNDPYRARMEGETDACKA